MAEQGKNYELLFLLKAKMDSSVNNFSTLGGMVQKLEQQVQAYGKTMSTIDQYQKQGTAIEELREKMEKLAAGTEGVNRQANAATEAVKNAREQVNAHRNAIDSLNLAKAEQGKLTTEQKIRLVEEEKALRECREALKNATAAEKEALGIKNSHQKQMDDLRGKIAAENKVWKEQEEALERVGVDTRALSEEKKRLAKEEEALREKEEHWKDLQNTLQEVNSQFATLRMVATTARRALEEVWSGITGSVDLAGELEYTMSAVEAISGSGEEETRTMMAVVKEMGATTVYSATEAAGALETMALAGWESEQMIAGLPAVVKLAAAAGEELSEMTGIVSDGMNAFHLTGEQAAVKFADVLAKTATSSNTTVALLGDSLSYVETTAGNLGYSIEDVGLALAAMANNALKGGAAGTALNTILTRMSGSNATAQAQMEEMGLSMYDAGGVAKDLGTFLEEVRQAFQGFGEDAQKAQVAAYNLAGMRGMRGLLAIVNQSEEQWEKLKADISDYAGAADTISQVRMDNYAGQVKLLGDAWDALKISMGEQLLPTATSLAQSLKECVNGADQFVQEHGSLVRGVSGGTATLLGLNTALITVAGGVQMLNWAVDSLNLGSLLGVGGTLGAMVAIAATAGVVFANLTDESYRVATAGIRLEQSWKKEKQTQEEKNGEYAAQLEQYERYRQEAAALARQIESMGEAAKGENVAGYLEERVERLNQLMPELGLVFDRTSGSLNQTAQELERVTAEAEESTREAYLSSLRSELAGYDEQLRQTKADYEALLQAGAEKGADLTVVTPLSQMEESDPFATERASARSYERVMGELEGKITETSEAIRREQAALEAGTRAKMEAQGITQLSVEQYTAVAEAAENAAGALKEVWENWYQVYDSVFSTFEQVETGENTTLGEMIQGVESQSRYFESYLGNLEKIRTYAEGEGLDLSGIWESLSDGSTQAKSQTDAIVENLEQLPVLLEKIQEKEGWKEQLADYQSEIDEQLQDELGKMEDTIANAVKDTGAYEEARTAMEETLQGYLDALENEKVSAAILRFTEKWRTALDGNASTFVTVEKTPSSFDVNHRGYASGTKNARAGWALVGEQGPELMYLQGGERILTAGETRQSLSAPFSGSRSEGGVTLHVHIPAGATAETVRESRQYAREIEQTVRKVLREERERTIRRKMV